MVVIARFWRLLKPMMATGQRRRSWISCSSLHPTWRMEADWSVEVGTDLPMIAVPWEGFVDLRRDPRLASSLIEVSSCSILAQSLIRLNQQDCPVFTSKCDHWLLSGEEIDPLEFDAEGKKE